MKKLRRKMLTTQLLWYQVLQCLAVVITATMACNVDMCSREYSSVLQTSQSVASTATRDQQQQYCGLLDAYQHCLKSIGRSCRGNLEFHTLQTLLKTWKHERNCSHVVFSGPIRRQPVRQFQRKAGGGQTNVNSNHNHMTQQSIFEQQEVLQQCLSAAYNYTINTDPSAPIDVRTDHRTQRVGTTSSPRSRSRSRVNRDTRFDNDMYMKTKYFPIKGEDIVYEDEELGTSSVSPSPAPTSKPSTPPSPPLTCIIYGDPHLRTFNNVYQTCKCLGAWPLIDHPLFTVQITNSKIKGTNPQVSGVTKVVVLIRKFDKCGILGDLLYEADSQPNQGGQLMGTPSATFLDGSTANQNNLVRITQSSNNNVVTIHLDHIGVRVYIGQFENSSHLNVVIKFRSATSTVKQQLVLNSISSNSLCKTGCPKRELIDIRNILSSAGFDLSDNNVVDVRQSAKSSDNSMTDYKSDVVSDDDNSDDESDDNTHVEDDELKEELCHELYGYYRLSCIYESAIKGMKDVNNAYRFAQSFDEMKFIQNSILNSGVNSVNHNDDNSVMIIANSSSIHRSSYSVQSLLIYILIVYFLSQSCLNHNFNVN
ncbi:uncharacterized protein LOC128963867 [Oppia nitens]|uniref:uncharacterized protein LOC128963867 n=1 Tax=Oppia nitens TaxID=1686743 RepID=UPI0023D9ACB4|nr:uncharacterized protein LOC128963867 [Oppia nitens]XP_054166370.1 uncharacterized protein LOC128963867 [Oppia nitens]XP_054166371.1 uncharacterized protein LOC128963867 [Oppia nitens]XP_054166372.1 uncharacterized protein LOC128963867 [Oppia nitens]